MQGATIVAKASWHLRNKVPQDMTQRAANCGCALRADETPKIITVATL